MNKYPLIDGWIGRSTMPDELHVTIRCS